MEEYLPHIVLGLAVTVYLGMLVGWFVKQAMEGYSMVRTYKYNTKSRR